MKTSLVITSFVVLLLAIVTAIMLMQPADAPTSATTGDKLNALAFPQELAQAVLGQPNHDNATPFYDKAFGFYLAQRDPWNLQNPDEKLVVQLAQFIVQAHASGQIDPGFLDDHLPVQCGFYVRSSLEDALEVVPSYVLTHAWTISESPDQQKQAAKEVQAILTLGWRAFHDNTRLYHRRTGLTMIVSCADMLAQWPQHSSLTPEQCEQLKRQAQHIIRVWDAKTQRVGGAEPHLGDLINVAANDQDLTFRVEAMLQLGILKHAPNHRGNLRAMERLIAQCKQGEQPLLQTAAQAAEAYSQ